MRRSRRRRGLTSPLTEQWHERVAPVTHLYRLRNGRDGPTRRSRRRRGLTVPLTEQWHERWSPVTNRYRIRNGRDCPTRRSRRRRGLTAPLTEQRHERRATRTPQAYSRGSRSDAPMLHGQHRRGHVVPLRQQRHECGTTAASHVGVRGGIGGAARSRLRRVRLRWRRGRALARRHSRARDIAAVLPHRRDGCVRHQVCPRTGTIALMRRVRFYWGGAQPNGRWGRACSSGGRCQLCGHSDGGGRRRRRTARTVRCHGSCSTLQIMTFACPPPLT